MEAVLLAVLVRLVEGGRSRAAALVVVVVLVVVGLVLWARTVV